MRFVYSRPILIAVMGIMLVWAVPAYGDDLRRDGNWWLADTSISGTGGLTKTVYMLGMFDGMNLGLYLRGIDDTLSKTDRHFLNKSVQYLNGRVENIKVGQLESGVDKFYTDYRNRSISVHDAVLIVVVSIWGLPEDRIEALTELARKNAANNSGK